MKVQKFVFMLAFLAPACASATPGGTDANGCHASTRIGFHCHALKPAGAARAAQSGRTAENRRLKRECKGRPNAGACAGYAR